jgi:hypothetical protein
MTERVAPADAPIKRLSRAVRDGIREHIADSVLTGTGQNLRPRYCEIFRKNAPGV